MTHYSVQQSISCKSHGALSNPHIRFHSHQLEPFNDDWYQSDDSDDSIKPISIKVIHEKCKSIITTNHSPDVPFDQSINPYRGCEHGCIYCFARPSHAYLDLSPGLDFETKLTHKINATELLKKQLSSDRYHCKPITLGTNTDCYQPIERSYQSTQSLLKVLNRFNHPVTIITKSSLILRDIELLSEMASKSLINVCISVTSLSGEIKRKLEPRTASPNVRLRIIKELTKANIPVTVLAAPIIPFINDHEIESIVNASADAGARTADYILLRLPLELVELFTQWLKNHYPDRMQRVISTIRSYSKGKMYDSSFRTRRTGSGSYAGLVNQRFQLAITRANLNNRDTVVLRTDLFRVPNTPIQYDLFSAS